MSKREELAKLGDKLLDDRQRARLLQLNAVERLLFTRLLVELAGLLEESNGRIKSRSGQFIGTAKAIDQIFDAVQKKHLAGFADGVAADMAEVLNFNANYYRVLAVKPPGAFQDIHDQVNIAMRRRLGIDKEGKAQQGQFLDRLTQSEQARAEVKAMVQKSVAAGIPMAKLKRALAQKVLGSPGQQGAAGVLEKYIGGFVLDTYQVADSITNNEFGKRLGLKYFIYSGGLIETSREFCRKKNNQVFTTEEANDQWPKDPTLPKTKAEKDAGDVGDYVPLEDRGRWNCRHRLLYISEEEAIRRRPASSK